MKIIGLDIGTTNIKGLVVDQSGKIFDELTIDLQVIAQKNGIREQDPQLILEKTLLVLKTLLTKHPDAKTFVPSTTMHSLMLLDQDYKPLTKLMIWSDTRSFKIIDAFFDSENKKSIHQKTGVPVHPMSWLGKILWIQNHQSTIWKKTKYLISFKEYLTLKLFNTLKVDYSIAASSGLVNQQTLNWDQDLMTKLKINQEMLGDIVSPTFALNKLTLKYKQFFNSSLKMVLGSSDGCLANLGSGIVDNKQIAISVGTSSAVRTTVSNFWIDKKNQVFSYPLFKNYHVVGGPSNNGGNILDWYRKQARPNITYQQFFEEFQKSIPGANGLIFLPYLNGERAPYWDANVRGSFLNLESINNQYDFSRSILEGITLAIASIVEILKDNGKLYQEVILSGGIIHEPIWIQLIADVLNMPIKIINTGQTVALGAVYIGFLALKVYNSVEQIKNWIKSIKTYYPNNKRHKIYAQMLIKFKKYYNQLYTHD